MDAETEAQGNSPLWLALHDLAEFGGIDREDGDLLRALQSELSELQRCWSVNLSNGARVARLTIWANLNDHIEKLTPRRANQKGLSPEQRKKQYIHAVKVSFNMIKHPELVSQGDYEDLSGRRKWLALEARGDLKIAERTSRRDLVDAITQIERQILAAGYEPKAVKEGVEYSSLNPLYTSRPALESRFHAVRAGGAKLIAFIGEPGMGKTWLAREVAPSRQGAKSYEIWCSGGRIDYRTLRGALEQQKIPVPDVIEGHEDEYLSILVSHENAPAYIVLDNLESTDELVRLRLRGSRTCVIATCRYEGELPHDDWHCISIENMKDDEAMKMIQRRLPNIGDGEAMYLALQLYGYPLVMGHACTLIERGHLDVREFCNQVRADAAMVAKTVRTEEGRALYAVLERTVELIRERNELAYELLSFIIHINNADHFEASSPSLGEYARWITKESKESSILYIEATRVLFDFALLKRIPYDWTNSPAELRERYWMHQLTGNVLKRLLEHDVSRVRSQVLAALIALEGNADATQEPSSAPPARVVAFYLHVYRLLASVFIDGAETNADVERRFFKFPKVELMLASILLLRFSPEQLESSAYFAGDPKRWFVWAVGFGYIHRKEYPFSLMGIYRPEERAIPESDVEESAQDD